MKQLFLTVTFLLGCLSCSFGQASVDSVSIHKVFGEYQFYQGDKRLKLSQLAEVMKSNEQAYQEIQAAEYSNFLALLSSLAGGAFIGWPIGTALGGGDPNWVLAGIGAGLIIVAIPISHRFKRQAKNAIELYNGGLNSNAFWDKTELRFAFSGNGIGLMLGF